MKQLCFVKPLKSNCADEYCKESGTMLIRYISHNVLRSALGMTLCTPLLFVNACAKQVPNASSATSLESAASSASKPTPTASAAFQPGAGVETLPDGNLRDAEPSASAIEQLVIQSKANLVHFKAGTFQMGDWGAEVNESGLPFDGNYDSKPLHKVSLSAFSMAKYPVTYAQFDVFTAAKRLPRINQKTSLKKIRKPNNPVGVTWQGAKDYCQWLATVSRLPFDLPTEAQWEYAARSGGKRNLYPTDNGLNEPGKNMPSYDQREAAGGLMPVGSFPPNSAGIYDMSAGFDEWVNDWYDDKYYQTSPHNNPKGPSVGTKRVRRGYAGQLSENVVARYSQIDTEQTGTWTLLGENKDDANREIPYTKYSAIVRPSFRCVLNQGATVK
jgi:formylglycine-generating enzyme